MDYQVVADSVTAETSVGPGRARVDFARGSALPPDVPEEDLRVLLARGDIAEAVRAAPEPEPAGDVPAGTAAAVLEWVAGDKDRAERALAVEQAKGDGARRGLVADLSKLVEA